MPKNSDVTFAMGNAVLPFLSDTVLSGNGGSQSATFSAIVHVQLLKAVFRSGHVYLLSRATSSSGPTC